jgi:hypothetical protein
VRENFRMRKSRWPATALAFALVTLLTISEAQAGLTRVVRGQIVGFDEKSVFLKTKSGRITLKRALLDRETEASLIRDVNRDVLVEAPLPAIAPRRR